MDKNNILQFEEDDTSKTGINGKQVFFAKRINGKTIHNKEFENEENLDFSNKKKEKELYIEFKTPIHHNQMETQTQKSKNIQKNKKSTVSKTKKLKNIQSKEKAKRRKSKTLIKFILLILIIIGITIFAMISPIFNIKEIKIKGNEAINSETIISLSKVQEGQNIFRIVKKDIISNIKDNQYINSVEIKRELPGTLEITVEERKVNYQIQVINSYVYIDYQGYILETSSEKANVPIISGLATEEETLLNGKRLISEDIKLLNKILKIMESAKNNGLDTLITKITIQNNEYVLELKKKNKIVYLGEATDLTNQMVYLKLIVEKEEKIKGEIFLDGDINSGFKPYFREYKDENN